MPRINQQLRRFIFVTLTVLLLAGCAAPVELHGSEYQTSEPAPDIPLATSHGDRFSLEAHHGQVVLVYFGYTHCPDICPATLSDLKWVHQQLAAADDLLQVVFVSIDPARDDPASVQSYLDRFNESFIGLIGSQAELEPIIAEYGVLAQRDPGEDDNYTMTHTSRVFLIDQEGILRTNYTFDEPREDILADVRQLVGN